MVPEAAVIPVVTCGCRGPFVVPGAAGNPRDYLWSKSSAGSVAAMCLWVLEGAPLLQRMLRRASLHLRNACIRSRVLTQHFSCGPGCKPVPSPHMFTHPYSRPLAAARWQHRPPQA